MSEETGTSGKAALGRRTQMPNIDSGRIERRREIGHELQRLGVFLIQ